MTDDILEPIAGPVPGNAPEFSVSEISGAVKRMIEGEFGRVRVRGEVGRVSRPASGHLYLDLKDDRAVLSGVIWKGQAGKLAVRPEEGMEVVATGRLTTFPGQSKYQMVIEDIAPAGIGALMAMLEKRRAALAAEGLFDAARKRPLPYLPEVIGVVTSPSGAVIRDILHRLRDRFPRQVLIWPVPVQGERCAAEVAAAIEGFNRLAPGGPVPRPDVLIVARGGGSVEDLWGFNEEIVVRAAAASRIPLISAVGHETDTTLIDHAADVRAPTPTAAAELAVPVRADLLAALAGLEERRRRAAATLLRGAGQRLRDLARGLPRAEALTEAPTQRLDYLSGRLPAALRGAVQGRHVALARLSARLRPSDLVAEGARRLDRLAGRLAPALRGLVQGRETGLDRLASRLAVSSALTLERRRARLGQVAAGLRPARLHQGTARGAERLEAVLRRLSAAAARPTAERRARLDALERLRQTLGYRATLGRGYAVVRGDGHVVTTVPAAAAAARLEIEFGDGRLTIGAGTPTPAPKPDPAPAPKPRQKPPETPGGQGSLF